MELEDAKNAVANFFRKHGRRVKTSSLGNTRGKVYELYCLAQTVDFLGQTCGAAVQVRGKTLDFKASPGLIDTNRSWISLSKGNRVFGLFTDIEVQTLSSTLQGGGVADRSAYHEIDLVLVRDARHGQRPLHSDIILGVECKSHADFKKELVRHALGVRRELSLYVGQGHPNGISSVGRSFGIARAPVNVNPGSEYWLAYSDPRGDYYREGPRKFGIELKHWCP